jgi:antitoxin MazE
MKVAKWGNSLAIRLPRPVVEALDLKEGDEVQIAAADTGRLEVSRDRRCEEALARIESMRFALPPGYKFDRDEANERGGFRIDLDEPDDRLGVPRYERARLRLQS